MKYFAFAAAALLASPALAQESPEALEEAFVAAIAAEDTAALADLYTEDAVSFSPDGGVAAGKDAITAAWAPFFAGFDNIAMTLNQQGEIAEKKSRAVWGLWTMTATSAETGEAMSFSGRYTDVAVKTKAGWKYRNDHASPIAMPAAETGAAESAPEE